MCYMRQLHKRPGVQLVQYRYHILYSGHSLHLSAQLAEFAPQLTLDFVGEVVGAVNSMAQSAISNGIASSNGVMNSSGPSLPEANVGSRNNNNNTASRQRIACLLYLSPWIKNLALFANPTSPLFERSGARVRDCVRVLCDGTVGKGELLPLFQKYIWKVCCWFWVKIIFDKHIQKCVLQHMNKLKVSRAKESMSQTQCHPARKYDFQHKHKKMSFTTHNDQVFQELEYSKLGIDTPVG
ncbi:hypothetical protein C8J56DRAFT_906901 [Mycena floridula]|nr:hypothetical protein C8J56DRAFT_906901 [Mycena floridula]